MHTLTSFPFSGFYEIPEDIGRGSQLILRGCLEKNISDRWNIAMVDDVAWGVGEGDDATRADPDEESELQHKRRSRPMGLEKLQTTIYSEQEERSPSSTSSPAPSSPTFSLERGRRPTKFSSQSPSPGFIPFTPPYGGRVSPIAGLLENLDEFHLDPSTAERSRLRSSYLDDEKSDAKRRQRTVGFEDEIADWTARNQDMETIERDDDAEVEGILEPEPLVTDRQQQQQRSGSVPCPNARWAKINNNHLYAEHWPAPADPFLNTLSRSRSAECNRSFD